MGIVKGYILPPIHFTLREALNFFLAACLMLSYAHRYDANIALTFMKLNSIIALQLRDHIQKNMDWMQRQPRNEKYLRSLATVAEVWVSQHQVKISYAALARDKATESTIEPYFIEPAAPRHSYYVIVYCHRTGLLRTFKIRAHRRYTGNLQLLMLFLLIIRLLQ